MHVRYMYTGREKASTAFTCLNTSWLPQGMLQYKTAFNKVFNSRLQCRRDMSLYVCRYAEQQSQMQLSHGYGHGTRNRVRVPVPHRTIAQSDQ
jgi:hypothetical protein